MDIEAATQQMVSDITNRTGYLASKMEQWAILEGTRQVGLPRTEPLKLRMACRILVRKGITLDDLAQMHS